MLRYCRGLPLPPACSGRRTPIFTPSFVTRLAYGHFSTPSLPPLLALYSFSGKGSIPQFLPDGSQLHREYQTVLALLKVAQRRDQPSEVLSWWRSLMYQEWFVPCNKLKEKDLHWYEGRPHILCDGLPETQGNSWSLFSNPYDCAPEGKENDLFVMMPGFEVGRVIVRTTEPTAIVLKVDLSNVVSAEFKGLDLTGFFHSMKEMDFEHRLAAVAPDPATLHWSMLQSSSTGGIADPASFPYPSQFMRLVAEHDFLGIPPDTGQPRTTAAGHTYCPAYTAMDTYLKEEGDPKDATWTEGISLFESASRFDGLLLRSGLGGRWMIPRAYVLRALRETEQC